MRHLSKVLVLLLFGGILGTFYLWSVRGAGVTPLRSEKAISQVKENCPNGLDSQGKCLQSSFRSVYFLRTGYAAGTGK